MKFVVTVVAILAVLALANGQEETKNVPAFVKSLKKLYRGPPEEQLTRRANVETKWITQKLDHFDDTNQKTWQMVGFRFLFFKNTLKQ